MSEASEVEGATEEKKEAPLKEEKNEKEENDSQDVGQVEEGVGSVGLEDRDGEGTKSGEDDEEEKKKQEELKKKYANWPMKDVKEPHENDVMYGRGGGTNHHAGNKRYRKWVEERKVDYVNSKRLDKPLVALDIIRKWRAQVPPGRFLKLDEKTGLWHDVGDKKAREKTSQALRENAPKIRQELEQQEAGKSESGGDGKEPSKSTRFSSDTKDNSKKSTKPALARDHSLGREYLQPGEAVVLDGFTWESNSVERLPSYGSMGSGYDRMPSGGGVFSRGGSYGSMGPPPQDYYPQQYPPEHYDSWGRMPSGGPPPPVPQMYGGNHSESFGREHSLANNPLQNATMDGPADQDMFDQRAGSGYWGSHPSMGGQPPMPPSHMSHPSSSYGQYMGGGGSDYSQQPHSYDPNAPPMDMPPSDSYQVASNVPEPWSAQNPAQFEPIRDLYGAGTDGQPGKLARPDMVKRMTSNQNEDIDTRRNLRGGSIKRATLSRDSSAAAARLKELHYPNMPKKPFDAHQEMNFLSSTMEQSTLMAGAMSTLSKPEPVERTSTVDEIAKMLEQPEPLNANNRTSTVDALLRVGGDSEPIPASSHISRPPVLRTEGRLSTAEYLDIVNEPIGLDEADARNTKPIDLATIEQEAKGVSEWLERG